MRYISTNNGQVTFVEANDQNVILTSRSFNFGSMYYTIKNNKITFYSADSETPYRSDLWTVDIPVTVDNEVYSTVEDAIEALGKIFDNGLTKKVDELEQAINDETARAISAETTNADAISAESDRAQTAEAELSDDIDAEVTRAFSAESELADAINAEEVRAINAESGITSALNAESTRAQLAEAANANAISAESNRAQTAESGITSSLDAEINRAQAAESAITSALDAEEVRAISAETELSNAISAEEDRAIAAESGITSALNAEIARAQAAEQINATAISGETSRAQTAEGYLQTQVTENADDIDDLEDDVTSAKTDIAVIKATMVTAAELASNYYNKLESDGKFATIANVALKADKTNTVASAGYSSQSKLISLYDISGNVLSSIDCTDFIKDGMVSNVEVSNGYLVITFNTDAGKEAIRIPLTDIFDPSNYYNKTDIDGLMSGKTDTAVTATLSGDVLTISGDVTSHVSNADVHVTVADKTSWADKYTQAQVDAKVSALSGAISDEASARSNADGVISGAVTAHTSDADIHVTVEDKANWSDKYTKSETDEAISEAVSVKADISAVTAIEDSLSGYTTTGDTNALSGTVTAHTANTDIHVTVQDKNTWSGKQDALVAGENITISGNVISAAGGEADDHFDSASTNPVENRVVTDAVIAPEKDYWVSNGTSRSVSREYLDGIVLRYKVIPYPDDLPIGATAPDNFQFGIAIADAPYGSPVWPTIQVTSFSGKSATVDNDNVHLEWDEDDLIISVDYPWSITRINCYTEGYRILTNSFSYTGGTVVDEAEKIIDEIGNVKQFANKAVKNVYLYSSGSGDVVLGVTKFNDEFSTNNFSHYLGNGLTCENGKIVTDLNVSLGYSGWTSVEIPMYTSRFDVPKGYNTFKLKFINFDVTRYYYIGVGIGNAGSNTETAITIDSGNVNYDSEYITSATLANDVLTFTATDEFWGGECYVVYLSYTSGYFSDTFSAVEHYGEITEPIVDYIQDLNSGLTEVSGAVANKQDVLVSGTNIKTINGNSILGDGNIVIEGGGSSINVVQSTGTSTGDVMSQSAVTASLSGKQDTLVSGTNIKTVNNQSLLGSGNIDIQGGGGDITVVQTTGTSTGDVMSQSAVTASLSGKSNTGHTHTSGDITDLSNVLSGYTTTAITDLLDNALTAHTTNSTIHVTSSDKSTWSGKQDALVSGTNIKTINGSSILGSGDITVNLNIWSGTAADYALISPKDPNTLYLVY